MKTRRSRSFLPISAVAALLLLGPAFLCRAAADTPADPAAAAASSAANNIRDFDKDANEIVPGRWAWGWFNARSFSDPKQNLRLFTQAYPDTRLKQPNWTVDSKKREICWIVMADGTVRTDRADIAWIYQVPATLAASGQVKITGAATSGQDTKNLRIYIAGDELLPASERAALKPVFEETGKQIAIDLTVPVKAGNLIYFIQNDTGTPPRYTSGHKLDVTISAAVSAPH
ncbi:hypothetical protein OpiT1DRAFT_04214 [Opitutaceae bacterium TAV1]|nr:hypothetical protein OpiT1DRAFT_04214 [Opitutaceae bacterium TAV1]